MNPHYPKPVAGPLLATLATLAALATNACPVGAASLGDPAAPLQIAEWIKGDPVDLAAAKGKHIVVVEFWATWCGPCRTSIPHLTELQREFADRGVVFVGVSDESPDKVRKFVDDMGDKMGYTVAVDRDRKTSDGYMKAYGQNGIPHAFVVDFEGRIAWHGHPMADLDKVLTRLAATAPKSDPASQKRADAQRLLREYTALAGQGGSPDKLAAMAAQLTALDRELGGLEPGRRLDLAAVRQSARFETLMRDYQRAVAAGRPEADLKQIEAEAAPLAPKGFRFEEFRGQFSLQRTFQDYYRAATGKGDATKLPELTARLESVKTGPAETLNEMAWTLLTDDSLKTRNPALALKLAQAASDASGGKDAGILDTYARALFDNGRATDAAAQLRRAIELTDDADRKAEFQQTLRRYQEQAAAR